MSVTENRKTGKGKAQMNQNMEEKRWVLDGQDVCYLHLRSASATEFGRILAPIPTELIPVERQLLSHLKIEEGFLKGWN